VAEPYLQCLLYMGDLRELVRELLPLSREAEERKDHFTLAMLHTGIASLMSLFQDQPAAARQQIDRGLALRANAETDTRLFGAQLSRTGIELYEGDGIAAYRRIDQGWRRRLALPFVRMELIRAQVLSLHGLAALAAHRSGEPGDQDRGLVRAASGDARALRALRMAWTDALARVLEAGVALATGTRVEARAALERAAAELLAAGMMLHAALARRRLGELAGDAEGAREVAEADAWLTGQGVRAPARLARIFMPEVG
jgi:eukaryotic-like serine/threonine-protein kinase